MAKMKDKESLVVIDGEEHKHISINPKIQGGVPCIKGTRITVFAILENVAAYANYWMLPDESSHIDEVQIKEALLFAADYIREAALKTGKE